MAGVNLRGAEECVRVDGENSSALCDWVTALTRVCHLFLALAAVALQHFQIFFSFHLVSIFLLTRHALVLALYLSSFFSLPPLVLSSTFSFVLPACSLCYIYPRFCLTHSLPVCSLPSFFHVDFLLCIFLVGKIPGDGCFQSSSWTPVELPRTVNFIGLHRSPGQGSLTLCLLPPAKNTLFHLPMFKTNTAAAKIQSLTLKPV